MLKVNEYFDGKVKSIGFEDDRGPVTSGVMEVGDCPDIVSVFLKAASSFPGAAPASVPVSGRA